MPFKFNNFTTILQADNTLPIKENNPNYQDEQYKQLEKNIEDIIENNNQIIQKELVKQKTELLSVRKKYKTRLGRTKSN